MVHSRLRNKVNIKINIMNYVEKVQLMTGLVVWAGALIGYLSASIYYKKINREELIPFLKYLMIAGSMIGTHQIFEFLSLVTGSVIVYKIGLLISLTGMVFYLFSLEKFYNRKLYVRELSIVVAIVAIYLFLKPVEFTVLDFHLEHHSIFLWSLAWFVLFMYWNICILFEQKNVGQYISKSLSWMYLLFSMTISFLIAAAYSIGSHYTNGVNICVTYPSVWCTFGVLQCLVLPFFLYLLPKKMKKIPPKTQLSKRSAGIYLFITIIITILMIVFLISTGCFNVGFILK